MKIEIEVENNRYGIEKIVFSTEGISSEKGSVELIVKIDSHPGAKQFAENLLFQQDMAISEGKCDLDSFKVKLPASNQIRLVGNIQDIVFLLKTREVINDETIAELEKYVVFSKQSQKPVTDFFADKSIFSGESKSPAENSESKLKAIEQIRNLLGLFSESDRREILENIPNSPQAQLKRSS